MSKIGTAGNGGNQFAGTGNNDQGDNNGAEPFPVQIAEKAADGNADNAETGNDVDQIAQSLKNFAPGIDQPGK